MPAYIDFGRVEHALASPMGWADLGLTVVCLLIAWLADQRYWAARLDADDGKRLRASFARVVFPLTALVLVLLTIAVYRRYVGAPLFLAIAAPMLIALATIRMIVYGLRRMFKAKAGSPPPSARCRSRSGASSSSISSAYCRRSPKRSTTS